MIRKLTLILLLFLPVFSFAANWNSSNEAILEDLKSSVQDTKLDKAVQGQGNGVKATLERVKEGSTGYIQWLAYIGLSAAFLLIIYNGIIILGNFGDENKLAKSKKRFMSLLIGVILVVGASSVIYFVVSIVSGVFK